MHVMGDETGEMLDREADFHNNSLSSSHDGGGLAGKPPIASTKAGHAVFAIERLNDKLSQASGQKRVAGKHPENIRPSGKGGSKGRAASGHSTAGSQNHSSGFFAKSATGKRRRIQESSHFLEKAPSPALKPVPFVPLSLDPDLAAALEEEEMYEQQLDKESPSDSSPLKDHRNYLPPNGTNGLNLRVNMSPVNGGGYRVPLENFESYETVDELRAALELKDRQIAELERKHQADLDDVRSLHQSELRALSDRLHETYSREASRDIRILCHKTEVRARHMAELKWKATVEDLKQKVRFERSEKTELVKACDEYLQWHGH